MDHHCPWINNCVGHFNHQYFILFCTFMCLGTSYVTVSSRTLFIKYFFDDWNDTFRPRSNIGSQRNSSSLASKIKFGNSPQIEDSSSSYERPCLLFVFMLCSAVTLALGILTGWHCKLISYGETSIEWHINKQDARKLQKQGLVFKNPYHFGIWDNWRMLLGVVNGRSFLCILIPSSHPPFGDGIHWAPLPEDDKEDRKGKLHIV